MQPTKSWVVYSTNPDWYDDYEEWEEERGCREGVFPSREEAVDFILGHTAHMLLVTYILDTKRMTGLPYWVRADDCFVTDSHVISDEVVVSPETDDGFTYAYPRERYGLPMRCRRLYDPLSFSIVCCDVGSPEDA